MTISTKYSVCLAKTCPLWHVPTLYDLHEESIAPLLLIEHIANVAINLYITDS